MAGIALLGAGLFAQEAHLPALLEHNANLLAIYSRSTTSAQSLLSKVNNNNLNLTIYADDHPTHTLDALLARPDITAVVIALPITAQPAIVRKCLLAGKHVLCEKPLAKDTATARALIKDYETQYQPRGQLFAIAEQFRHDRAFTRARDLVQTHLRGKVAHVHARMWGHIDPVDKNQWYETEWRKTPAYQGGFVLDGGVHFIALVRYVSGLEVVRTASLTAQVYEFLPPLDTVNAALSFGNGAAGSVSISFASVKRAFEFVFVGEDGCVIVEGAGVEGSSRVVCEGKEGEVVLEEVIEGNGVSEEVRAFLESVEKGKLDERLAAGEAFADLAVVQSLCEGGGVVETL
ncbi:hypothetical protein FE257_012772 [Aspergillus nanangensis]|uniref:NAD(P)-binding protein n=1 Tax=Aspergillus nanangensis TaxID=2582783 RepID=A0AAD4GQJ2_ASPNN|nr:hypothetical protein FE257_012772 [Aspergillus nanangensis]